MPTFRILVFRDVSQRCGNIKFNSCYFSNLTRLEDRGESVFIFEQWNNILVYILYTFFFTHQDISNKFNSAINVSKFRLLNNFFLNFFMYHQLTVCVSPVVRVPLKSNARTALGTDRTLPTHRHSAFYLSSSVQPAAYSQHRLHHTLQCLLLHFTG